MNKRYKLLRPITQKYKLTNLTRSYRRRTLHRIQALMSFSDVKAGDFGGWVESYDNLSQFDNCWIYDNAQVYGNAKVSRDATVRNYATVSDSAQITD